MFTARAASSAIVHHRPADDGARPGRLYLQNHWGLYRSDDAGDSWQDGANGVPSDFGFCMEIHPKDPDRVFIVPLHSDGFRCVPEGKLRVYSTRDGGESWSPLSRGLPQRDAFETIVRDAVPLTEGDKIFLGASVVKFSYADGFDVVHTLSLPYNSILFAGYRLARRAGARLVTTPHVHTGEPGSNRSSNNRTSFAAIRWFRTRMSF